MPTHQTTDRDRTVIAKYLLEAHGKERQLESALQAQILLAKRPGLEHALSDHLEVTRDQVHAIEERLRQIGQEESKLPGMAAAGAVVGLVSTVANKSLALAKGPLQALRGTSLADNDLRNVRDCYWNEAEEIAHYRVIETIAEQLGDTKTVALAQKHRKEEEQMQRTLEGLLPGVVRSVVESESPDSARDDATTPTAVRRAAASSSSSSSTRSASRTSNGSSSTKRASSTTKRAKPAATRAKSKARSTASKASSTASKASSTASKAASSTASKAASTADKATPSTAGATS